MILIAGPCVVENYEILKQTLEGLLKAIEGLNIEFYFKSSCVKDNRSNHSNYSGPGFLGGLQILDRLRQEHKVKICTDFHSPQDIERWAELTDVIQIPAYLSQQTSLLKAASETNKTVFIKKGQFLGPEQFKGPVTKLQDFGAKKIIVADRGTTLGYDRLFMDPRHVPMIKKYGYPVLADITHPTKITAGKGTGRWNDAYYIAVGYLAAGADGIFMETHPAIEEAECDSVTMVPLETGTKWIKEFYKLYNFMADQDD